MTKRQTQWLLRILQGGGAGALLVLALWGPLFIGGYSIPPACQRLMDALGLPGAVGVTLALAFSFGAAVGVATATITSTPSATRSAPIWFRLDWSACALA